MAILNGNVIGNFSGRLGNLAARIVDGKTILAARPSSYTVNNSPAALAVRGKFHVTVDLSKTVLSLPTLAAIWHTVKISGMTVFNTIFRYNYPYSSASLPTADNLITPGGFSLPVTASSADALKVTASLSALNTASVFTPEEVNLSADAIVCFTDPINSDDESYQIIACSKEVENFNFTENYELQIDYDMRQQLLAAKYSKRILLLSVASKTADGKVVQYSATSPKSV